MPTPFSLIPSSSLILGFFVFAIFLFFIGSLLLMITTKLFKTNKSNYRTALKVFWAPTLISLIISFTLFYYGVFLNQFWMGLINLPVLILYIWLISRNYSENFGKSIFIALTSLFFIGIVLRIISGLIWVYISSKIMGAIGEMNFSLS